MYDKIVSDKLIKQTISSLGEHNIGAIEVESLTDAKKEVEKMIPEGSEVMTMTSLTLDQAGISKELDESDKYNAIRPELYKLNPAKDANKMRKLAAAPDYVVGSANAVSEEGSLYWASATGSQLGAYAYTAGKVILVVSAQKIVKDREEAIKRIYDYVLPLESERAQKAYGVPGSVVNKFLEINSEANPERIKVIIVKEKAGF